jgi:putative aldouronate transport system permease protein
MRIDGGNELSVFIHIVFPTSLPMFAAIALFVAVGHWNDWFTGAYFVTKQSLVPVQTYLQMIMNRNFTTFVDRALTLLPNKRMLEFNKTTSFSLKIAAVVLGTAPILIVYPFLQKYFVKGVLIGSIKE